MQLAQGLRARANRLSLPQVVEDSVLSSGGEVMRRERELRSMHESLRMTVAIPFLFGVPPAFEMLRCRSMPLVQPHRSLMPPLSGFALDTPVGTLIYIRRQSSARVVLSCVIDEGLRWSMSGLTLRPKAADATSHEISSFANA